jgi:two-component system sensor histidine kinase RegB
VVGAEDVTFTVKDSGAGMSDEVRARVGEPFFTSKSPGEGMGLGVYLTKLFAQQVGGAVSITSVLGQGSEVVLTIPKAMRV